MTLYAMLYTAPAVLALVLTRYGWRWRHTSGARPFIVLMLAIAWWCSCHALGVASTQLETVLFWSHMQYVGIASVGPSLLLFALEYSGREHWVGPAARGAMIAIAALTFAAVITNASHGLWWREVSLSSAYPFGALALVRGPLFWLHTAVTYTYIAAAMLLFIQRAVTTSRFYSRQALLIIVGALIPVLGNLALLIGGKLPILDDPTPFLLLFSGIILFYATSRYQLLALAPIAQRSIFESLPDGVIVIDQRGIISAANGSAAPLLPPDNRSVVGQPLVAVLQHSPLGADVQHMVADQAVRQTRRITYRDQSSELHGVEIRLEPLYDRSTLLAGSLVVFRDITEQVQAEHARDQRLRDVSLLQQVARAANNAIAIEHVLSVICKEMVSALPWHRAAVGLLQPDGTTLRLAADQSLEGVSTIAGRSLDAYTFSILIELARAGRLHVLNTNDPAISGTSTAIGLQRLGIQLAVCVPLASHGQKLGIMFVCSAVERTVTDDELRLFETLGTLISDTIIRTQLYESAQEASQIKSAFLATVSHELRTPLTSVIGFADMLQGGMFGPLPGEATEAVTSIQRGSHLLLRLINDILDFSKMESGHFVVDLYPVDLTLVVQMVVKAMHPQLYARGLIVTVELPALPVVQANSTHLEQIVTNLIANAIKFTDQGSVSIVAVVTGARVRLSVRDTGIGIEPEDQEYVFEAFRQIDTPLTRRYGGTGLGLAICKRLVTLMGGTISVESTPGVGSTFHVDLHAAAFETLPERASASEEKARASASEVQRIR
ncbi:MAG: PAS domain-containing protein [Roseiflexaceae bacterium]|nr:PAS domain-containing protein [Roseiflexaceae bacterium]